MSRLTCIKAVVDAAPPNSRPDPHQIGWLPTDGWFCTTCANTRCKHIHTVKEHP